MSKFDDNELIEKIKHLHPSDRKKVHLLKKKGRYNKVKKKFFDRDYLLEWAKSKGIKDKNDVMKKRQIGEPSVNTFEKVFGSWEDYLSEIGIKEEKNERIKAPENMNYIINLIIELGIYTAEEYRQARKKRPDIVPTLHRLKQEFGSWNNAFVIASRVSLKRTVDDYVKLRKKLKKWPSITDCRKEKIDLKRIVKIHGTKKNLDSFLEKAEEYEN